MFVDLQDESVPKNCATDGRTFVRIDSLAPILLLRRAAPSLSPLLAPVSQANQASGPKLFLIFSSLPLLLLPFFSFLFLNHIHPFPSLFFILLRKWIEGKKRCRFSLIQKIGRLTKLENLAGYFSRRQAKMKIQGRKCPFVTSLAA